MLELMIATTLLALVLAALVSALSGFSRTASRMDEKSKDLSESRAVRGFLKQSIGSATKNHPIIADDQRSVPRFIGEPSALTWLGIMPARFGAGGLTYFNLGVSEDSEGAHLVLRFAPFVADDVEPDWGGYEPVVIADDVEEFTVAYLPKNGGVWLRQWTNMSVLPGSVSVAVTTQHGKWPPLVVAVLSSEPVEDFDNGAGANEAHAAR